MTHTPPTDIVNVDFWADRIAALIKLAEHYGMAVEITGGELVVSRQVSDVFVAQTEVRWRAAPSAAVPAGLVAVPPTTTDRDRIAEERVARHLFDREWTRVIDLDAARGVLAVLPAGSGDTTTTRADTLREAADICDEAGAVYASKDLNDQADAAFRLMERFQRKANEAEYVATPCSVGGCEPGGEPCTTHERLMAHAEGDHELCAPDCGLAAAESPQPDDYEVTTGHLITCLAVAGGSPDPDCPCAAASAGVQTDEETSR